MNAASILLEIQKAFEHFEEGVNILKNLGFTSRRFYNSGKDALGNENEDVLESFNSEGEKK